ncbi:hypothetical protein BDR06DRAFT_889077 [Suillus hirtellus]|nr:hypothetical protein BDR06DRAFT_889077 [Suillus hirtellus]
MPYCSISDDLKLAVICLYNRQLLSILDILDAVGISHPTFFCVLKQYHATGHVSKLKSLHCGQPRALNYSDIYHLLKLIKQRPDWFLDELQHLLETNCFISVHVISHNIHTSLPDFGPLDLIQSDA